MNIRLAFVSLGVFVLLGMPVLAETPKAPAGKHHSRVHDALQTLNLTPDQHAKIKEIVKNNPKGHRMGAIMKVLTPEQQTKLRAQLGSKPHNGTHAHHPKPAAGQPAPNGDGDSDNDTDE